MAHTDLWPRKTDCSFTTSTPMPIELELDGCCSSCLPVILHPLFLSLFFLQPLSSAPPALPLTVPPSRSSRKKKKMKSIMVVGRPRSRPRYAARPRH